MVIDDMQEKKIQTKNGFPKTLISLILIDCITLCLVRHDYNILSLWARTDDKGIIKLVPQWDLLS